MQRSSELHADAIQFAPAWIHRPIQLVLASELAASYDFASLLAFLTTLMKNNLLSLGQLLEKGFKMSMEQNFIKIYDKKSRLVLKAPLSKNKTFKTNLHFSSICCGITNSTI